MGKPSRDKGKRGERELAAMLQDWLGVCVSRSLGQERDGGADINLPGIGLQVKREERLSIGVWWRQTEDDANKAGLRPVLAYRQNGKPWKFLVGMDFEDFCEYASRE